MTMTKEIEKIDIKVINHSETFLSSRHGDLDNFLVSLSISEWAKKEKFLVMVQLQDGENPSVKQILRQNSSSDFDFENISEDSNEFEFLETAIENCLDKMEVEVGNMRKFSNGEWNKISWK